MPISRTIPLLTLLWMFLYFMTPAHAATLNVPTATYPTIQAAVNASQNGDTVLVADGTYSGPGNSDIDFGGKNITVTSQHGAASTIIDCGGSSSSDGSGNHRGFYLHQGETNASISGITIKNGYTAFFSGIMDSGTGGGICIQNSSVSIQGCTISGNIAQAGGGGVYDGNSIYVNGANSGTVTLANCTLLNNNTDGSGGGVYSENTNGNGTITLISCTISGNTAHGDGGGIRIQNSSASVRSRALIQNCTVSTNISYEYGAGIDIFNGISAVALTGCTISGNTSYYDGGGVYNDDFSGGTITLTDCTVSANAANNNGGGVYNDNSNGMITLTNCTISGNAYGAGGGVYTHNGSAAGMTALTNCILFGDNYSEVANDAQSVSSAVASHCDVEGGYDGIGNISADPLFVSAAGGNLHLRPGSPCLGAGTSSGAPATDKDGVTRPSPPSIGAYEATPSHTHLLWNNTDARVMLWSVAADGSFTLNGFGPYTDGAPQNVWHATAVATGADGVSHLLWNNTDGRVMLWTVDDAGNFTLAGYGPYTDNAPQNKWSAVGVSVGPDNTVHLLWSNTDRRAMLWNVDSAFNFTLAGFGPYTDNAPGNLWSATALATGPDNVSRILWNNTDNRVMLWNVDSSFNFTLAGYGPYTDDTPQHLWSAAGVSVGPDNVAHLLWSNTDRRAMFWDVNPDFSFTLAGYGPYTDNAPQNLWSASAVATGPDGLSHLLWNNTDNRAMLWGLDSAFDFSVAGYGPYTDNAPANLWSVTAVSAGP